MQSLSIAFYQENKNTANYIHQIKINISNTKYNQYMPISLIPLKNPYNGRLNNISYT